MADRWSAPTAQRFQRVDAWHRYAPANACRAVNQDSVTVKPSLLERRTPRRAATPQCELSPSDAGRYLDALRGFRRQSGSSSESGCKNSARDEKTRRKLSSSAGFIPITLTPEPIPCTQLCLR